MKTSPRHVLLGLLLDRPGYPYSDSSYAMPSYTQGSDPIGRTPASPTQFGDRRQHARCAIGTRIARGTRVVELSGCYFFGHGVL
jgi:hypothetical protein